MVRSKRKAGPPKDSVNKAGHSMNPDRAKLEPGSTMRSKSTIRRLQMQRNFKPKRDRQGKIVRPAPFQNKLSSGSQARVEPNRRWFGNTRVIGQDALQHFQDAMMRVKKDPRQVVLRATKAPVSLLTEKAKRTRPVHILDMESFEWTFGKKAQRKRPRCEHDNLAALVDSATAAQEAYETRCARQLEGRPAGAEPDVACEPHFRAGQSRRVWNELYKVVDSSDVLFHVLDARDPEGTRCRRIEQYLATEHPHKHLVWILNKVDLVPKWVARRWLTALQQEHPTVAFRAHLTKPFGKKTLLALMRQYPPLFKERKQISIGLIGYPNVGKSSVINTMRSNKVCNVAPIAGETKVWQYVRVTARIYFIDCPGVVYPEGATEAQLVLKGVVRVEYLRTPELYVAEVLRRVRADHLCRYYGIARPATPPAAGDSKQLKYGAAVWPDADTFLEALAQRRGKLLRAGEPDLACAAKIVLNDFQRGQLPYFTPPPPLPPSDLASAPAAAAAGPAATAEASAGAQEEPSMSESAACGDLVDEEVRQEKPAELAVSDSSTVAAATAAAAALPQVPCTAEEDFIPMLPSSEDEADAEEVVAAARRTVSRRGTKRKSAVAVAAAQEDTSSDTEQASRSKKLGSSRQRRREERESLRPRKVGQHFYAFANVKNRNLARRLERHAAQEDQPGAGRSSAKRRR